MSDPSEYGTAEALDAAARIEASWRRSSPVMDGSGPLAAHGRSGHPRLPAASPVLDRRLWSYREIAAFIRVQPETVRSYRRHGLLPPPDRIDGVRPFWYAGTIRSWDVSRPGNRARTQGGFG
jgi:hypothetical protein